ncbi:hypothetical protein H0H92_007886 [Tricholoma furcatifolium]|nr:hypothetical protein H0H92_007886 [Tricholoma furcatifolium]
MSASRPPWEYTINHVYFPPRLPQSDDSSAANDIALCELVIQNAQAFAAALSSDGQLWSPIIEMMRNLQRIYAGTALDKAVLQDIISKLSVGDTLVVPIRARNACVVFRAGDTSTIIESFEIDPPNQQVMAPTGRLIRRFPEAAFELANTPESASFQHELAAFLADMDAVDQDSAPSAVKAGSKVFEVRDTADPHHIVQMMNAIVHGFPGSKPYEVERIEKRVRNEILCDNSREPSPWRRSPLWLIIRVALQTTLCRESVSGITEYKSFMIFMLSDIILSSDDYKSFSADILVCIQNKIVRRFRKLSDAMSRDLMHRSTEAISKAKDILEARWGELKKQQALSPPWAPDSLDIPADTNISLVSSKAYLLRRLQESVNPPAKHVFQPSETRHINDDDLLSPQRVLEALSGDPFMTLVDLEQIAIYRLDGWVDKYSSNSSACLALGECITHYAAAACKAYDNPEDRSMMMLTIFVLWSGFDRLAIILHPLLADYSPEISCDILEPILLRKFDSIHALICLKEYLQKRHSRASRGSVYEETLSTSSFAIRYFTSSSVLNQLKRDIEKEARAQREEKRAEFSRLSARYTELIRRAQTLQHFCWDSGYYRPWNCTKCSLERQASKLTISVHEWPLPSDTLYAQATVFELQCPPVFQAWRTITYTILSDHCRLPKYERSDRMAISLAGHSPLTRYCKEQSRITYASSTRPFVEAHYSTQAIAHVFDDLSSILVNCGLRFSLFDYGQSSWIHTPSTSECSIEPLCNFTILPSSPYYSLEYAVKGTMHSANKPLADQADAHPDLSVHEHIAFGTLRSGHQIQWLNIVRSLRERILSFDRFEVHLLIAEAAQQTGWIKDAGLEWHNMLKQLDFGLTLLSEIDDMMSTIKSNWHHINTLYSLIILTVRLLGACTDDDVVVRAYSTLRMAREVAYAWVLRLLEDLKHADSDAPSTLDLLRQHICLAAATCRATYDVDPRHFDSLIAGDNDVHKLIHCAIQIQDNQPREKKPTELNLFLARDRKLSFVLEPIIQKRIEASRGGIDAAILAVWSDYKEGSPWKHLTIPNERWFTSIIIDASTLTQSVVHYNLTDGTLLIDGKPLGRLPSSIVGHPTYKRILGKVSTSNNTLSFNVNPGLRKYLTSYPQYYLKWTFQLAAHFMRLVSR